MSVYGLRPAVGPKGATQVVFGDSPAADAFSRNRVSEPVGLFDVQFRYDLNPRLFEDISTGNGSVTHEADEASAKLAITAGGVGVAGIQTYQYFPYQPGKSQLIFQTFTCGNLAAGQTFRVGYFDDDNGIFFEGSGDDGPNFCRRSSTTGSLVLERILQADWNLDTFDGSGTDRNPSGQLLDTNKAQILIIDLQFLGVGRIRIGFDINGVICYGHEFLHANINTGMYMQSANLPIRWVAEDTGTTGISEILGHCVSVISEGGMDAVRGIPHSVSNTSEITSASGADTHLLSVRPALTFNSIANRSLHIMEHFHVANTGVKDVLVKIWYDAPPTGGSWVAVDASDSSMEYNITATHAAGTGVVMEQFLVPNDGKSGGHDAELHNRLPIALNRAADGRVGVITITAQGVGGGTSLNWSTLTWREIR